MNHLLSVGLGSSLLISSYAGTFAPLLHSTTNALDLPPNAASFTVNTAATLRFFQLYFYTSTDGSGTPLANGVVSALDNNNGAALTTGNVYYFDANSVYNAASYRGISMSDVHSMKVYLDNGTNNPWQGVTALGIFTEDCSSGTQCITDTGTTAFTWSTPLTTQTHNIYFTINNGTSSSALYAAQLTNGSSLSNRQPQNSSTANSNYTLGAVVNNGFLYLSTSSPADIKYCSVNPANSTNAMVGACTSAVSSGGDNLSSPQGLAISEDTSGNPYLYAANATSLTPCAITNNATDNGKLTCYTATPITGATALKGLVIYQGYAYMTDSSTNRLYRCAVNGAAIFSNECGTLIPTVPALSNLRGIAVYNGYFYIVNYIASNTPSTILACAIPATDSTDLSCSTVTFNGTAPTFASPNGIAIYNGYADITNSSTSGRVITCPITSSSVFGPCTISVKTLNYATGVTIY